MHKETKTLVRLSFIAVVWNRATVPVIWCLWSMLRIAVCPFCALHACCALYQRERVEGRRAGGEGGHEHTKHRLPFGEENPAAPQPAPLEGYSCDNIRKAHLSGGLSWASFTTVYVRHIQFFKPSEIIANNFTSYIAMNHITDLSASSSIVPPGCRHLYPLEGPGGAKLRAPKTKLRSSGWPFFFTFCHKRALVTQAQSLKCSLASSTLPSPNQLLGSIFLWKIFSFFLFLLTF